MRGLCVLLLWCCVCGRAAGVVCALCVVVVVFVACAFVVCVVRCVRGVVAVVVVVYGHVRGVWWCAVLCIMFFPIR